MNTDQPRASNLILCYSLISLGVLCFLLAIFSAVYLKDGIIERAGETTSIKPVSISYEINSIEQQIKFKDQMIRLENSMPNSEKLLKEAQEKLDKAAGKKSAIDVNQFQSESEKDKADKIKKLEDEKASLISKKNELTEKMRANSNRRRTWGELADDYNFELLFSGVIPLLIITFYFSRVTFFDKLPKRNLFALSRFEQRCVLFLPFAIVSSAFGFFLFVWILTITS